MMIIIASKGLLLVHSTLFLINDKDFIIQGDIASSHTIPHCSLLSYGGPGTQTVTSKWAVGWDTFLASHRNFIVANIDVRGTGFQVSSVPRGASHVSRCPVVCRAPPSATRCTGSWAASRRRTRWRSSGSWCGDTSTLTR